MTRLSHSRLLEVLRYDPASGELLWISGQLAGSRAGTAPTKTCTYRKIMIDRVRYLEHVVAVFYTMGRWPADEGLEIDHRNRIRSDNRWDNLRCVTRSQNQANHNGYKGNKFTGASYCKRNGQWAASIRINSKSIWLGYHPTAKAAHAAWVVASKQRLKEQDQ